MKTLKLIAIKLFLVSGVILSPKIANAELLYPVEIIYQPTQVRISNIRIEPQSDQLLLSGTIKRRAYNSNVLPGHIDYIVFDVNDQVVTEGAVNYSSSLSLRRLKQGAHFSFLLPKELDEGSYIRIGWNRNHSMTQPSQVTHHKKSPLL
ncbi:MAG: hypothetical protein DRQ43_01825 [Gammaproteobacteria bacterium]|nr:MAG: hypothetical protein DRQ43_01825 [Gammaproteobacteria bacterium]